MTLLQTAWTI